MENPCLYCGISMRGRCSSQEKADTCTYFTKHVSESRGDNYVFGVYKTPNGTWIARHIDGSALETKQDLEKLVRDLEN